MTGKLSDALLDDLEITVDFLDNQSVLNIFFGELFDRRADMLEALIRSGEDEMRFKIQMLDEVIGLREEIDEELKSRRSGQE